MGWSKSKIFNEFLYNTPMPRHIFNPVWTGAAGLCVDCHQDWQDLIHEGRQERLPPTGDPYIYLSKPPFEPYTRKGTTSGGPR